MFFSDNAGDIKWHVIFHLKHFKSHLVFVWVGGVQLMILFGSNYNNLCFNDSVLNYLLEKKHNLTFTEKHL